MTSSPPPRASHRSYDSVLRARVGLPPGPVFAALGALSAAYFAITGTVWAVTGEFTRLGGHAVELLGADPGSWTYYQEVTALEGGPLDRTDGWIVIAMLAGSLLAALWADDFRVRTPPLRRRFPQALAGGIVAGFGARLAFGCNLAAMFTGIPQFSLHAWLFTLTTAIGTWLGVQLIRQRWWRGPTRPVPASARQHLTAEQNRRRRVRHLSAFTVIVAALAAACLLYLLTERPLLAVAVVFGTVFGALIQRGQICFTAAFRDLWVTRKTKLSDALVIGLATAVITTFVVLLVTGMDPLTKPAGWGTVIGGTLFGLGIVMAGACETGMMYRAMEGQTVAWVAFGGNVIGATVLAYGWDHWGIHRHLVASAPPVSLTSFGGLWGALVISLVLLALWWLAMSPRRTSRLSRLNAEGSAPAEREEVAA
ncbi:selenium metabolism membrane protein YedE/FdhT [Helcobacillus massiliensis]|uniref:YeeE/YedE family protein n=1 Tax=Helcobacillus massiliensis TaxID=521392 RepID=A0A839QS53_9MICO|nr:hypothetical protein [Helcobacillus massiliensis]